MRKSHQMLGALIKRLTNSSAKRRLFSNIFSLGVLQSANYILPLLTLPYLARVLEPNYFGLLAFATVTTTYFTVISDYGFNLSATRKVSIHRNDPKKINEIFSSVMVIKVGLLLVSILTMTLLVFSFDKFTQDWKIYYFTFGMTIGHALFPVWFFQGIERMKYISYFSIVAKSFFVLSVFVFVQEKDDYWIVPILNSIGSLFVGFYSLSVLKKRFSVMFIWPTMGSIRQELSDGWHVFLANLSISLYVTSTVFILGLFTSNVIVGQFTAAEKLVRAAKMLYGPVSQAIYPMVSQRMDHDRKAGLVLVRKISLVVGGGMFVVSTLLFLFASSFVHLIFGSVYYDAIILLRIMAFLPFILTIKNMIGVQTMLNLGLKSAFGKILFTSALLGIGLNLVLVSTYGAIGSSVSFVVAELLATIVLATYVKVNLSGI